ncbi:MAG TPA: hypothetical protein VGR87_09055 [Candidatus Limnocylindria bacterium]|jgi:hypothetical protein|nr:hypothetical protein [Candidatus Limnocylindria bacterium]
MADRRTLPPIRVNAVAIGLIVAVASATVLGLPARPDAPIFGIAAPLCGVAIGGFLAGKLAKYAGAYHGALAGAGYVLAEVLGLAPAPFQPAQDGLAESLWIIAGDAALLSIAALAGWLASPRAASSSSSDKGRGR